MLLFPADVLRPRRVDDHFVPEAEAARELGVPYALVDHNALTSGEATRAVAKVPEGEAIYRGWMLTSDEYAAFDTALAKRGATLRTTAAQYRTAHELPGWHAALEPVTPAAEWTSGAGRAEFDEARRRLGHGPAVLRDYTKSMKHYWDEAVYIPSLTDADAAWRVASRFLELRADDFAGGFVLRRFESFTGAEVRTWWYGGECRLVGAHPDTPDTTPDGLDLAEVTPLVTALALPFITVDLVRHDDGRWRVVELGDGQVSDRPASMSASDLVALLA
ncbi:ATP-grasp domain-containing protein [Actinophytocola sp.]|uniref:ATP-grasp domain-containing protein n=1 Tax=Actinophytocola sp. TaxID=1872138 RepID=UPI002ED4AF55